MDFGCLHRLGKNNMVLRRITLGHRTLSATLKRLYYVAIVIFQDYCYNRAHQETNLDGRNCKKILHLSWVILKLSSLYVDIKEQNNCIKAIILFSVLQWPQKEFLNLVSKLIWTGWTGTTHIWIIPKETLFPSRINFTSEILHRGSSAFLL